jgi:hypothetical protein
VLSHFIQNCLGFEASYRWFSEFHSFLKSFQKDTSNNNCFLPNRSEFISRTSAVDRALFNKEAELYNKDEQIYQNMDYYYYYYYCFCCCWRDYFASDRKFAHKIWLSFALTTWFYLQAIKIITFIFDDRNPLHDDLAVNISRCSGSVFPYMAG